MERSPSAAFNFTLSQAQQRVWAERVELASRLSQEFIWWSPHTSELGSTTVWSDGTWAVAVKAIPGNDAVVVIEEVRIFPLSKFAAGKEPRQIGDRGFWLDESEDWLIDHLPDLVGPVPGHGITTTVIRGIPWGRVFDAFAGYQDLIEAGDFEPVVSDQEQSARGRSGSDLGDAYYAQRAAEYLRLVRQGDRHPVQTLAQRSYLSREAIATQLKQARRRGLLESAGHGRKGGRLTPRAQELLQYSSERTTDG